MGIGRIWPLAYRTIGAMISSGLVVRLGCSRCGDFFDVDLIEVRTRRGPTFCLIDRSPICRRTICRGPAYFAAALTPTCELRTLVRGEDDPLRLNGLRACDLEPPLPPDGPDGVTGPPVSLARLVQQIATSTKAA